MRRVFTGLVMAALTVLALAGPASAAPAQVTQFRFAGTFGVAGWITSSGTGTTAAGIVVSQSKEGSKLMVDKIITSLDANGNFTGETVTRATVTSGFSFTTDPRLTSATLSASALPATTCIFDANFNVIGCSATTIDVNVAWTGQGPINRTVTAGQFKADGFSMTTRIDGTSRNATAIGTIGGLTLSGSDALTSIGTTKEGLTTVCIGSSC